MPAPVVAASRTVSVPLTAPPVGVNVAVQVMPPSLLLTALTVAYRQAWHVIGIRLESWLPPSRQRALTVAAGALLTPQNVDLVYPLDREPAPASRQA